MTESGFEMPPDHMVSQMLSTLDLSSPAIMISPLNPACSVATSRKRLGEHTSCSQRPYPQILSGRSDPNNDNRAWTIACNILNQMIGHGRPMSYRIGR